MTFTTRVLTGERVLVKGTDIEGTTDSCVVDGSQWFDLKRQQDAAKAEDQFGEAVEQFFAPLLEAAEKFEGAGAVVPDELTYIVLDEGEEGVAHRSQRVVGLTPDSVVLRAIEEGQSDRLVWVDSHLEVLAVLPSVTDEQAVLATEDAAGGE